MASPNNENNNTYDKTILQNNTNGLWNFIKLFTQSKVLDEKSVLRNGSSWYLVTDSIRQLTTRFSFRPVFCGALLGRDVSSGFIPSVGLLQLLVPHASSTVTVSNKGAWLFICGRDLWSESLTANKGPCAAQSLVLVLNSFNECIGIGQVVQKLSARGLVVKNLFDIGWFVRKRTNAIRL